MGEVRGEWGCGKVCWYVWEVGGDVGGCGEVLGEVREGVLGCGGGKGKCGECGKVLGEVWKGEMWGRGEGWVRCGN